MYFSKKSFRSENPTKRKSLLEGFTSKLQGEKDSEYLSELGLDKEEQALLEDLLSQVEEEEGAEGLEELVESFEEEDEEYEAADPGFRIDFEPDFEVEQERDLDFVLAYASRLMKKHGIEEAADKEIDVGGLSLEDLVEEEDLDTHMLDVFMEDWEDEI